MRSWHSISLVRYPELVGVRLGMHALLSSLGDSAELSGSTPNRES